MPETQFDLSKSIFDLIEELGLDGAAKFFGRTAGTIAKWKNGSGVPDVAAAQKVLDKAMDLGGINMPAFQTPPPQGQTKPESIEEVATKAAAQVKGKKPAMNDKEKLAAAVESAKSSLTSKIHILTPCHRDIPPSVMMSFLGTWKATLPPEVRELLAQFDQETDTTPHHSRNMLATRFLKSGREWAFWIDSDMLLPFGNAGWFRRRTGAKYKDEFLNKSAIERLTSRGKTLISAVYAERTVGGRSITSAGKNPDDNDNKKINAEIKKGPQDKVIQIQWAGFGCMAVHRKVFEDILQKVEGVKSKDEKNPHGFFTAFESGPTSEDVAFCKRAAQAGHPTFLDLSVHCAHVGKFAYMPS